MSVIPHDDLEILVVHVEVVVGVSWSVSALAVSRIVVDLIYAFFFLSKYKFCSAVLVPVVFAFRLFKCVLFRLFLVSLFDVADKPCTVHPHNRRWPFQPVRN
ncbi:hypothetical protein BDZ91DRAFT_709268 [Kalaharituber pfeilii]|nr:hypothetical protein BDZ91DRAFT_709268 [Kalaharituber pfeilii]